MHTFGRLITSSIGRKVIMALSGTGLIVFVTMHMLDAVACIGCGACVAACPNGSAMLFTAAKVSHLASLPQGHPERHSRVLAMVDTMDQEGFGSCSNYAECEAVCPKGISVKTIAHMNREYMRANLVALVT